MSNNKLSIEKYQQLTRDLVDICNNNSKESRDLLEYIIDDYLYRLSDDEASKLEDIIVNEFGYD